MQRNKVIFLELLFFQTIVVWPASQKLQFYSFTENVDAYSFLLVTKKERNGNKDGFLAYVIFLLLLLFYLFSSKFSLKDLSDKTY